MVKCQQLQFRLLLQEKLWKLLYRQEGRWEEEADGGEAQDGAQGTEAVHSVHGFGHFSQHGYFLVYFTS